MNIMDRDHATIWHPYTQHQMVDLPIPIARGKGAYLIDQHGHSILDMISSWWVNLHGHSHPEIAKAIYEQAMQLEHVIFANFTHEPAVMLAEKLLTILPIGFSKIFYSDNGSTAVEVALKLAYQFWRNQGAVKRKRFIAFTGAYHGDTFGAMSVGKKSGFFQQFEELFFHVEYFPYPATWLQDADVVAKEQRVLMQLSEYLEQHGIETAALIIEPLVQGAGGMRMCRPEFLQQLEKLVRAHDVLIIYDEVMTGFGRTGELFACRKANTTPDIVCLAKGITGGFLPLAVTACQERIYTAFLGKDFNKALAHGHSFTANPLGCAAALASFRLLTAAETIAQMQMITYVNKNFVLELLEDTAIEHARYCGTIMAFDLKTTAGYGSSMSVSLREKFYKKGLLVRPLGNVIYFMPPYCISETELRQAFMMVREVLEGVSV